MLTKNHSFLPCVLIAAVLLILVSVPLAAEDPPTAAKVLDRFVEATGGADVYAALENRVIHGHLEITAQGLVLALEIYHARPDKTFTVAESDALGRIESGIAGDVVWENSLIAGPRLKEGDERAVGLRAGVFDGAVRWRELFTEVALEGVVEVDGRPCDAVVLKSADGPAEKRFFDRETGLLAKIEITLELPAGTIPMEIYPGDYREVDGVLLAHRTRIVVLGQERLMTYDSIEHNVDLPDDRFELPETIAALVAKKHGQGS